MKWIAIFLGVVVGCVLVQQEWTPFIRDVPHQDAAYEDINESNKREFIRTLFETFESANPHTEIQDIIAGRRPAANEVNLHKVQFNRALYQFRINACPIKKS